MKIQYVLITTLLLLLVLGLNYKDDIKKLIESKTTVFQVQEVIENPKRFENFSEFQVQGITKNTTSMFGFKGFSLMDNITKREIYIIPKGLSLPTEKVPLEVKVKFHDQYKLLDASFIFLKEVE